MKQVALTGGIALAISCFFIFPAAGQDIQIGLRGGLSIPRLSSSSGQSQGYTSRLAPTFGALANIDFGSLFSIEGEVNFAGQGGQRNGMQPIRSDELGPGYPPGITLYANFKNAAVLNYLEVPVLGRLTWGDRFKYYVNAGPYVGFLLSAKSKSSGNSQLYEDPQGKQVVLNPSTGQPVPAQSFNNTSDIKNNLHTANFGFCGGIGGIYAFNERQEIFLDLRAGMGIVSIEKDKSNGDDKTGNAVIAVGYTYKLAGRR